MDMTEDLGRRVKAHRTRLHLSQRETAQYLGVSIRALQTWEAGQAMPWPGHRRALEQFLATETIELGETA
jgi:transcriptional regulator with XRE-family HTH domain